MNTYLSAPSQPLKETAMTTPHVTLPARILLLVKSLGPYALIELLLPGGSLIALALWLYRHRTHTPVRA